MIILVLYLSCCRGKRSKHDLSTNLDSNESGKQSSKPSGKQSSKPGVQGGTGATDETNLGDKESPKIKAPPSSTANGQKNSGTSVAYQKNTGRVSVDGGGPHRNGSTGGRAQPSGAGRRSQPADNNKASVGGGNKVGPRYTAASGKGTDKSEVGAGKNARGVGGNSGSVGSGGNQRPSVSGRVTRPAPKPPSSSVSQSVGVSSKKTPNTGAQRPTKSWNPQS